MTIKDIKENLVCRHKLTGEVIEFFDVKKKKNLCKVRYLFTRVNKKPYQALISGFAYFFKFDLWQKIDKSEIEIYE